MQVGEYGDYKVYRAPSYCTMIEVKDFIRTCVCGGFIDYDGYGYISDGERVYGNYFIPSQVFKGVPVIPGWVTHIAWINR